MEGTRPCSTDRLDVGFFFAITSYMDLTQASHRQGVTYQMLPPTSRLSLQLSSPAFSSVGQHAASARTLMRQTKGDRSSANKSQKALTTDFQKSCFMNRADIRSDVHYIEYGDKGRNAAVIESDVRRFEGGET